MPGSFLRALTAHKNLFYFFDSVKVEKAGAR
jgi:hypothetical protein